eukprot:3575365-Amphidinium_carterae.1
MLRQEQYSTISILIQTVPKPCPEPEDLVVDYSCYLFFQAIKQIRDLHPTSDNQAEDSRDSSFLLSQDQLAL